MTITYEVYLDCLKIGLVANPKKILSAGDVCSGVDCGICPVYTPKESCWDRYLTASKKYYPVALKENPEALL